MGKNVKRNPIMNVQSFAHFHCINNRLGHNQNGNLGHCWVTKHNFLDIEEVARRSPDVMSPGCKYGGAEGARTPDPRLAKAVLSQLSYSPTLSEVLDGFTRMPENILAQFGAKKQRGRLSLLKASTPCYIAGV